MSAEAVPTTAERCVQEFVTRLNRRVPDSTKYQQFMPLLTALIEQSSGRIDRPAIDRIIQALPPGALISGAEPLAYLRRHWGPGLTGAAPRTAAASASASAASRSAVPHAAAPNVARGAEIVRAAASPSPAPSASPSPSRSPAPPPSAPSPAPSPSPAPAAAAAAISVAAVDRALIRDAAEAGGGTVRLSWTQSSIFDSLGIPRDTFGGFCSCAVGEFLARPDTIETVLRSSRGKIDLINAHNRYRGSGRSSYAFITDEFRLTYVNATAVAALTPQNTLSALETHRGTKHMIGLTKTAGGTGHAVGLVVSGGTYTFFDAEEGVAVMPNRDSFWRFLYRYITHETKGLATDYQRVFVATWS